jgi:hypothetical protein
MGRSLRNWWLISGISENHLAFTHSRVLIYRRDVESSHADHQNYSQRFSVPASRS